jgi:hypothetical protein
MRDPMPVSALSNDQLELMRQNWRQMPGSLERPALTKRDWLSAGCCNGPRRMTLASRQLQFASAFALSSQICDGGLFLPGSLDGERNEGVPSFESVPRIELRINP